MCMLASTISMKFAQTKGIWYFLLAPTIDASYNLAIQFLTISDMKMVKV